MEKWCGVVCVVYHNIMAYPGHIGRRSGSNSSLVYQKTITKDCFKVTLEGVVRTVCSLIGTPFSKHNKYCLHVIE